MSYGIIEYNDQGKPKCEICGKHFSRVLTHVRQKHEMTEREYKLQFGFDLKKGICSEESSSITREKTLANFDKVIADNLLKGGKGSRFKKGSEGRTKDKVSEQTRIALKSRLNDPESPIHKAMEETGRKLGLSGKGNAARWGGEK